MNLFLDINFILSYFYGGDARSEGENMEMQRFSSLATFIAKIVFPSLLFAWFAVSCFMSYFSNTEDILVNKYILLFVFFSSLGNADKKSVKTDGKHFYISNYFRKVKVLCASLRKVESHKVSRGIHITLTFNPDTPFGPDISIISPLDFKIKFSELQTYVNHDDLVS